MSSLPEALWPSAGKTEGAATAPTSAKEAAPTLKSPAAAPPPQRQLTTNEKLAEALYPTKAERTPAAPAPAASANTQVDERVDVEGLRVPKGYDPKDKRFAEFRKAASELGVNAAGAQRLFDLHHQVLDAQQAAAAEQPKKWAELTRADKEIGGTFHDLAVKSAGEVVREFGTAEFRDLVDSTGYGNHPELIRILARVGKALREARRKGGSK